MPINAPAVAYAAIGGLVLYSGIKGATLADTAKAVLAGNLNVTNTEVIGTPQISSSQNPSAITSTGNSSNTALVNQAIAKKIIQNNSAYTGWDSGQNWTDLISLWNQESGWNSKAKNPTSGAFGIPQALPPTKMPINAQEPTADPTAQIEWGLAYILNRYGSPVMAWAHEQANNWY